MTRISWVRRSCLSLWALLCIGCFSNADFAECNAETARQPCGINGVCSGTGEECVEMPLDRIDAGTGEGGAGGEGGGEGGEGGGDADTVRVDTVVELAELDVSAGSHVIVQSASVEGRTSITDVRIIELVNGLNASGQGQPGGLGGGAGAGQDTRPALVARGGMGAEDGGDGDVLRPGDGGAGQSTGPANTGLSGGAGGDMQMNVGANGLTAVVSHTCADFMPTAFRPGGGGSGAGGGRGGLAMDDCVGPGGGGGGAGGPAGGVIVLQATEEIIIRGPLIARGEAGGTGHPGHPGCAICGSCANDAGNGGDGADAADELSGDPGGAGAGRGGNGGAGSGGIIIVRAPSIRLDASARIDVSGGTQAADSSGLVYFEGQLLNIDGTPISDLDVTGAFGDRKCLAP